VLDIANITKDDIELYMGRYDKNSDRRIRFSEFSASFSPCDPYFKDKLESRKATDYTLSEKTRLMYRNLWMTHFKIE